MSGMKDWNTWNKSVIAEFRAGEGRAGGDLEGMPIVLVHHLGRRMPGFGDHVTLRGLVHLGRRS
jgi:hypothetical protein